MELTKRQGPNTSNPGASSPKEEVDGFIDQINGW
jgi:hypothetical protein